MVDLGPDDIEPAPAFGTGVHTTYVQAMGKIGDNFAILINTDLFLSLNAIFEVTEANLEKNDLTDYTEYETGAVLAGIASKPGSLSPAAAHPRGEHERS